MQLSTNLPSGQSAVEHISQHPDPLPANVSREADAAFMAELKRTDESRYNRLVTNIRKSAYALARRTEVGPTIGRPVKYKSVRARRAAKAGYQRRFRSKAIQNLESADESVAVAQQSPM